MSKRCHGDRSAFCRMEVLQQYCSLLGFQRMCCKSCKVGNITKTTVTTSKPPSKTKITTNGRSTTTQSPTRTESTTVWTSTAAFLPTTEGKSATSVSTPWLYTILAMSPFYPYTTTPIYKPATPEQSTSFAITTPSRITSAPADVTELPVSTVSAATRITSAPADVANSTELPVSTVSAATRITSAPAGVEDNTKLPVSTVSAATRITSAPAGVEDNTKLPVSTVSAATRITSAPAGVEDNTKLPVSTVSAATRITSAPGNDVTELPVSNVSAATRITYAPADVANSTELPVSTVFPVIFSDLNNGTTIQFKEFDGSSGAPDVDSSAILQSTTVNGVNEKELTTSVNMDVSIPVTSISEVLTTTEEPAPLVPTAVSTTSSTPLSSTTASGTEKTSGWPNKVEEVSESNAIDIPYRIIPLDNEFPVNNIIPRRGRVFLREKTRNKRIQELLEEKRNFLRRMKRAQGI
ncbi:mucin-5AC-like [Sinocyclocheilus anshuiensis]|uniref:mucin-5AC-like n=1 Tax=Sinocyclocheilus anshuiensis TaxID=1608454 RepID=UPI0007B93935|nr:PREDICTED: mucin-5AC-like [Sinocyclocheilus anshuiensis]